MSIKIPVELFVVTGELQMTNEDRDVIQCRAVPHQVTGCPVPCLFCVSELFQEVGKEKDSKTDEVP